MSSRKKQKQISIEEYIGIYCQEKRIRERFAVYITPEVHHNLKRVAQLFGGKYHVTASSLADTVISRHIETYRELLNKALEEDERKFLKWLEGTWQDGKEEPESPQGDDEV